MSRHAPETGWHRRSRLAICTFTLLFCAEAAYGVRLEVDRDAAAWAHVGAAVLLWLHIGGGTAGLVSGVAASLSKKGSRLHRQAGRVFLVSMFVAYLIGAGVAPFLNEGQRPNLVAGILALYLLVSGVAAARRRDFRAGGWERAGLGIALVITGMGLWFAYQGANSASGTVDGSPPQAFVIFVVAGLVAAADEVNVLVRGSLGHAARRTRHLWRMSVSFFIASGSLFLGQPQLFPAWFNESPLPALLAAAPLLVMFTEIARGWLERRARVQPAAADASRRVQ